MKTYALIENDIVVNVIEVGDEGWDSGIDISEISPRPGIGWTHDADAGFIAPAAPEPEPDNEPIPERRIITNLAFDLRFTLQERIAIELASIDDPSADMQQRAQAAALRVSQERAKKASFTDLDDPVTRGGVDMMEQAGLLAQGRALEILDDGIQDHERPT